MNCIQSGTEFSDSQKSDSVFIVNGCINKTDGNFLREFHLNQIQT